jgi:TPR repeat protein
VVGQDVGERGDIVQKPLDGAGWQGGKCGVGRGEDRDVARRRKRVDKACGLDGCDERGKLRRAIDLYRRSCDVGDITGCVNLADLLEVGLGVGRNLARACDLFDRACDAGDAGDVRRSGT